MNEHAIIGTQKGVQGSGQTVPEDLVLCMTCGWMRGSEYDRHVIAASTIHLSDPNNKWSFCGDEATLIKEAGDERPVCQKCHRAAMQHRRGISRDALARALYLDQAYTHQHPDDPTTPERRWAEGFEYKSLWFHRAEGLLHKADLHVHNPTEGES